MILAIGDKLIKDLGVIKRNYHSHTWLVETDRTQTDLLENLKQFNSDIGKITVEEE